MITNYKMLVVAVKKSRFSFLFAKIEKSLMAVKRVYLRSDADHYSMADHVTGFAVHDWPLDLLHCSYRCVPISGPSDLARSGRLHIVILLIRSQDLQQNAS